VDKDVVKAVECYKAAFRRGDYSGNAALAYYFQHGEGVVRNEVEAFAYLSLAAADFPQARTDLDKLGPALSADQRAAGQRRAKEMHSEVMAARESKPLEYR
jgi:hypothetical protein